MSILYGTKTNQLLANTAPTGLLFADWLKKKGYSGQLQKKYRDSVWLTAMCKGLSGKILGSFFSFIVFCIFAL